MSLFLIAGSIASTLCSCAATDSSAVVGYIDEHPITMEEFNYFLSQQKSSVCQSYSQLYGITSFDSAFWNNEYGDSTPLDSARASAKEACLEAYATQMLAEKTTSAEFLSFSQLKENAENFNTARKESTSNGGIVYGPIEYSFDSYYHRYLSQLENDIKEYWISTNAVSDADIDAFYSENQNLFSLNGDADVSAIYLSYIPSDLSADNIFPQMGTTDFYGTQLYWGNAPDIGVHEYQQGEYNDPANFALGKTVTSNNSHESLTPDLMVDGIYSQSSRWAAANSDLPIWLDIDFGEDTTFNKVVLTENIVSGWASPRIASFNLQIPTSDGYQTIYTYDGEIGEGKDFTFDTVTASHLRMEITSLRADTSTHGRGATDPSIVEFEVYKVPVVREPQNLLLNKSVSASSSHPSCPASKVNDGDASQGSRWAAANSDLPAWLEFDLGSEQTFNSVTITENIVPNWASERITGLEFQAWNGTEYTTISTYSGTIGTSKTISLPETTSSKFKVLITGLQEDTTKNSKGQTDPSIQEIELYYR